MTWRVEFDRESAFVVGPKVEARRRLAVCGDTSPVWVGRRSAWATSTHAANRLLDQLESKHIRAVVENRDQESLW